MRICSVIPAYDERGNLEELTKRLVKTFQEKRITYKIIYIIQGRIENLELIKKIAKRYRNIDYLYYPEPLGIGKAYKIGFKKVNKSWSHVLTMDADLNHQPEELSKFIKVYEKTNADIIIGSRFIQGGNTFDKRIWKIIASQLINRLVSLIIGCKILDKTSGYRLIKTETLIKIRNGLKESGYTSYLELILNAKKNASKIIEIPITYFPRKWGVSKMGFIRTSWDYLRFLYTQTRGTPSTNFV